MDRRNNIRWGDSDKKKLAIAVANYNRKRTRLKKAGISPEQLPPKVLTKDIRENVITRNDLKREISSLERFMKDGAEELVTNKYGLTLTKYQVKEAQYMRDRINRYRKAEKERIGELEAKSRGETLGYKRSIMETIRMNELKPKQFNFENIEKRHWEARWENLKKQATPHYIMLERNIDTKDNYLKALENVFGDNEAINDLRELLDKVPIKKFIDTFYSDAQADFDYVYDTQSNDYDEKVENVLNAWVTPEKEQYTKTLAKKYGKSKKVKFLINAINDMTSTEFLNIYVNTPGAKHGELKHIPKDKFEDLFDIWEVEYNK